ncbi:Biotin/lipoyl attachment [Heracleum sosnowskyi]|uniref:Biotin/lipoyl attachment n=1 Tax=Heracleum sosnowskyi TaxID=360622 RepID=A0AAD8I3N2_9APIA|nr:Biotin/lipoyl attachment [Heracleum sosnowskyi]
MESAAVLRSFQCTASKPAWSTSNRCPIQGLTVGRSFISSPSRREMRVITCVKTSDSAVIAKSDDSCSQGSVEKSPLRGATFPGGFEALVKEVCDETQIAELKLKIGDFEMHLKRNIEAPVAVAPVAPAPVPTAPKAESTPASLAPSPPKTSPGKTNPFTNIPVEKSRKLAALEASGASGYVLVASPTVGSFRKGRTLKGKKQPPSCKEGDLIKEGQVIGFLDQFGTELPVKSDVAGEVLKLLFDDGEAVGYGDPLIAVLPSFHGIS